MCCDCSCGVSTSDGGGEKVTGEKGVNADESGVTGKDATDNNMSRRFARTTDPLGGYELYGGRENQ